METRLIRGKPREYTYFEIEYHARDGQWHGIGLIYRDRAVAERNYSGRPRYRVSEPKTMRTTGERFELKLRPLDGQPAATR